jgi:exopolyphosphatase/pppGpp-phosphohydrolase
MPDALRQDVEQSYCDMMQSAAALRPATWLTIGASSTAIASGSGATPEVLESLDLGAKNISVAYFQHQWPNAYELEQAIMVVEDRIAPARSLIIKGSKLFSADSTIREIAQVAGLQTLSEWNMSRAALEQTFERLAAISLGRPASLSGLPDTPWFAATLLILREFMHHMNFDTITGSAA